METIDNFNFKGKKVLVRVDFNVPLDDEFNVTDTTRLKAAKPTITKISKDGGIAILISHLGRPKSIEDRFSLRHIVKITSKILGLEVKFTPTTIGEETKKTVDALHPGDVLLLENLRFFEEETKGDQNFSKQLSELADVYVNDAFGCAHRAHASTTVVAQFFENKLAGYIVEAELKNANKVLKKGIKPITAIIGGSKISDKILIIEKLLNIADYIIIGGAMSYTFSKAKGGKIGGSLHEDSLLDYTLELEEKAKKKGIELILPIDNMIGDAFSNDARTKIVSSGEIPNEWQGFDIGPESVKIFDKIIQRSKTIIWNGPMGVFEIPIYAKGTIEIAKSIKKVTKKGAFSLIGGGDSAAAINSLGFGKDVSYISTGGGALLKYMEGKTLPGIAALM